MLEISLFCISEFRTLHPHILVPVPDTFESRRCDDRTYSNLYVPPWHSETVIEPFPITVAWSMMQICRPTCPPTRLRLRILQPVTVAEFFTSEVESTSELLTFQFGNQSSRGTSLPSSSSTRGLPSSSVTTMPSSSTRMGLPSLSTCLVRIMRRSIALSSAHRMDRRRV